MSYLLIQANVKPDGYRRFIPLADESIQCVVTSPPYWGLRDYGVTGQLGLEPTPDEFVASMVAVFREVRRVLRSDGTCFVNLGDSYNGSGPSGGNGKQYTNVGSQATTVKAVAGLKPKDLIGIPWRVALALQTDGWYLRSDIIWAKPNPMPESVTDRPTKSHEYLFLLSKSEKYYFDSEAVREPLTPGSEERYAAPFVDIKTGTTGTRETRSVRNGKPVMLDVPSGRNIRTVWTIPTESYPGSHFATFPRKLVEPCIKAGSKPGDIVLDPFIGSGTTIVVANALGRHGIGIDLSREYLGLAAKRINRPHQRIQRPGRIENHPLFPEPTQ